MTKLANPQNDIASKMTFSENNIEVVKDCAESIRLCFKAQKPCICGTIISSEIQ